MIDVFVDAFVFEPTNNFKNNIMNHQSLTYLHEPPSKRLHYYLRDFNNNDSFPMNDYTLLDDLQMCYGSGEGAHSFMQAEGYCRCLKCEQVLCCECTFLKKK
jgi:hypothetical protein